MRCRGLILARGGAKRVPRKNLRVLGNTPLIAWTIMAGRYSNLIDRLVVSSEDDEILAVAKRYRAEPLRRPVELATDEMTSYPPIIHALDALDESFEWVCLLQPTSPFRTAGDIDRCLAVREVCRPAIVSVEIGKSVPNGAIYVGETKWLREELAAEIALPFDRAGLHRFPMPSDRSLDIDTEEDFAKAEAMLEETAA